MARYLNAYFQIQPRERQHRFNDLDVHDPFHRTARPDGDEETELAIKAIRGKVFKTDDGEGPYRVRDGDVGTENCAYKATAWCLVSTQYTSIRSTKVKSMKTKLTRSGGIG